MTELLIQSLIFLAAAVIIVPISKHLGLGSVLGYLIAGIVIGPVLGLVGAEAEDIQHFAEFGVVMMLFLVGLELEPRKLWELRHKLLGLGGLQVGLTTFAVFAIGMLFGLSWSVALAVGLVLSLSSTAIVLQTLGEQGLMKTHGGQSSFSVLLFQDIAVIPMLALIPLLALPELSGQHAAENHSVNILAGLPNWLRGLATLGAIGFIIVAGHYLAQPVFRIIAKTRLREMFTAFTLLLVIGISALMSVIGLSPALGTFLAGVVLANSEYRHELESNIEPFKGLLLGLFFITVGAGVNFELLSNNLGEILALSFGIVAVKMAVLFILGKVFKLKGFDQWLFALGLAQAGEFGFVLLSFTVQNNVIPPVIADKLLLIIALSMLITPLLFIILDKIILPRMEQGEEREMEAADEHGEIIVAGLGRFGQIVNRMLINSGYKTTVMDLDVEIVEGFSKLGFKTYFGDATRPELLASAGIDTAKLLVVAIDDKEKALGMIRHVRHVNPDIQIVVRAYDRPHCYDLFQAGSGENITIIRETFDASIRAGRDSLIALGFSEEKAKQVSELFYHRDRHGVYRMAEMHDPDLPRFSNHKMIDLALELNKETTELIQALIKEDE